MCSSAVHVQTTYSTIRHSIHTSLEQSILMLVPHRIATCWETDHTSFHIVIVPHCRTILLRLHLLSDNLYQHASH